MLSENLKTIRKQKGLSQQEFVIKLNVVRQTVSKWENGLSVPDSDMLISISEILETPVGILLGDNIEEVKENDLKVIAEKLKVINLQLAQRMVRKQKLIKGSLITLCAIIIVIFLALILLNSSYLNWNYSDPETAILGVGFHALEWSFVKIAPLEKIIESHLVY